MSDFLVIGAGLAGLSFAREMRAKGASVQVLDKGRGVGGRAATRRFAGTRVDHGAQFFTARSTTFSQLVAQGLQEGWICEWYRSLPEWRDGSIASRPEGHPRYACPEGMSTLPKFLSQGLDIVCEAPIVSVQFANDRYQAQTSEGQSFSGKTLVLNLPPTQLDALVPLPELSSVTLEPCWALLVALEQDLAVDWPALELTGHPIFSWIARDHTKRRPGAPPTLVAHAAPAWSEAHLEDDKESAAQALRMGLEALLGPLTITELQAHRWRYAKPQTALGQPFYWDGARRLGACGDWCEGGRVEGAFLSGQLLANSLV